MNRWRHSGQDRRVRGPGDGDGGGSASESPFGGANVQNQFGDLSANRAPAPTDQRHRGIFYWVWQPQVGKGPGFGNALIRDWGLSGAFTGESRRPYSSGI